MISGLRIHDGGRVQIADAPGDFSTSEFLAEILRSIHPGSEATDWDLKDGMDGRVLSLELTLEENQVRSRDDLYLLSKAGTNELPPIEGGREGDDDGDLAFEVASPEGKTQHCEAPADTSTAAFLRDLVDAFRLPKLDAKGRAIGYRMLRRASGEGMDEKKTLAQNGVEDGEHFYIERKTSRSDGPDPLPGERREKLEPDVLPTEDLRFQVFTSEGTARHCQAPADTSTKEFVGDIVDRYALPKVGPGNRKIVYALVDQKTQRRLDATKTLAENAVHNGQHLLLRVEATDLEVWKGWVARNGKMAGLAALGLLVLIGVLWLVLSPKPSPAVAVAPGRYTISPAKTVQFEARVTHRNSQAVHWTIHPAVGTISPDGLYTAPVSVDAEREVEVLATIDGSGSLSGRATLTLLPSESVPPITTPGSGAADGATGTDGNTAALLEISPRVMSLNGGDRKQFTAGGAVVQWSLNPAVGTISQSGWYTAPAVVTQPQRVQVIASGDNQATATVTLQPVAVTGVTASGDGNNGPITFSAAVAHAKNTDVAWSINPQRGSISSSGVYMRDPKQRDAIDLTVTATSVADPSKSAATKMHLVAPRAANPNPIVQNVKISLNKFERVVLANQSTVFSATVTGSADRAVTWAVSGQVGTIFGNGLFIAPKNAPAGDYVVHISATSHADPSKKAAGEFVLRVPAPYAGAKQGTLVWTGDLGKNAVLTIEGLKASTGSVRGELPGVPVAIRIDTPKCALVSSPGPGNEWKAVAIRTGAKLHSLTISWSIVP
jgi:hypothetical protein